MISHSDFMWLVGLLEGEGSFQYARNTGPDKKVRLYPRINVSMTDEDVVARVASLFQRSYHEIHSPSKRRYKPAFRTDLVGSAAAEWMRRLAPYMGTRRQERIREILDMYGR